MDKIRVITASSLEAGYGELAEITKLNLSKWCATAGYDFRFYQIPEDVEHKSFYKIQLLLSVAELPPYHDYIMWFDIDSVVRDMSFRLEPWIEMFLGNADMLISADMFGMCCSHILARNTNWVRWFLKTVNELGVAEESKRQEQDSMKILFKSYSSVSEKLILDTTIINDIVKESGYKTGIRIDHCPNVALPKRLEVLSGTI